MTRFSDYYHAQVAVVILLLGAAGLLGSGYYFSKSLLFLIDGVTVQASVTRQWKNSVGSGNHKTVHYYVNYTFADPEGRRRTIEEEETPPGTWNQLKEGTRFDVLCLPYDSARAMPKPTVYATLPLLIVCLVLSLVVFILGAVMIIAKWRAWAHRLVVTELSADHITLYPKRRKKPRPPGQSR